MEIDLLTKPVIAALGAEARGLSRVLGWSRLQSETLSQNNQNKQTNKRKVLVSVSITVKRLWQLL